VRALGRERIPVAVVSEARRTPASVSRYCRRHLSLAGATFTDEPEAVFERLTAFARTALASRAVLFPTADPDLAFVARYHGRLQSAGFLLPTPPPALIAELLDKARFAALAERWRWPVPRSVWLAPAASLSVTEALRELHPPFVFKPARPGDWHRPAVRSLLGEETVKARLVERTDEAIELGERFLAIGTTTLVQEYIPGPDGEHYDLHAYISSRGEPLAWFCGQKLRLYPPHAGSGCYVRRCRCDELVRLGLSILADCGFIGIANMNFKRDARSGAFRLLEINARLSQWNLFPAVCGVNIPAIAHADLRGASAPRRRPAVDDAQKTVCSASIYTSGTIGSPGGHTGARASGRSAPICEACPPSLRFISTGPAMTGARTGSISDNISLGACGSC
jgi:predicted ATP-grasp superfamily ATP-dependent carboligase